MMFAHAAFEREVGSLQDAITNEKIVSLIIKHRGSDLPQIEQIKNLLALPHANYTPGLAFFAFGWRTPKAHGVDTDAPFTTKVQSVFAIEMRRMEIGSKFVLCKQRFPG